MVARLEKHTGPVSASGPALHACVLGGFRLCADCVRWISQVSGLEFSELTPNRLASGADEGDLLIWDLKNPSEPTVYPPLKVPIVFLHTVIEDACDLTGTLVRRVIPATLCLC
jgi:hypothetical protein